jgi:hypothetical protein
MEEAEKSIKEAIHEAGSDGLDMKDEDGKTALHW